jgi:uncharacterized membrane protein YoaK (UPF0700 family)
VVEKPAAIPPSPRLVRALLVLTFVAGLVDAVSFIALGHVFTANMTGNVVFLAFAVAGVPGLSVPRSSAALAAFLAGATAGGRMSRAWSPPSQGRQTYWTAAAFGCEAVLLLASAAVILCSGAAPPYLVIVMTGFAMGVRNATVRRLAVPDLTTTVLTLTLTGLAAESPLAGAHETKAGRRMTAIVTMFAGAALGARLLRFSPAAPLALGAVLSASAVMMLL